jgi:hypothetical protein
MLGNIARETSTAPGTGTTVTLNGATAGRRTFLAEFGAGAQCFYFLTDGTQTEAQIGTVAAGPPATLTRGTPVWTSAAGTTSPTRLNFTGAVTVYGALPAQRAVYTNGSGDLQGVTAAKLRAAAGASEIGEDVLTAANDAAIRALISAAKSGAITGSGLTMATARVLGRTTPETGAVEEIGIGAGLALLDGALVALPVVLGRAYAQATAYSTTTAAIPNDDTIPQITEGVEVLTLSYTPKSATSRVRVNAVVHTSISNGSRVQGIIALFLNGGANAVYATGATQEDGNGTQQIPLIVQWEHDPGSTSAQTYAVRVGPSGGTMAINGLPSGRRYGGVQISSISVTEFAE